MSFIKKFVSSDRINLDLGLLVIRLGIGLSMFLFHGYGKITGGPDRWEGIGGSMATFGITFLPTFWGFMAAFSESACSILLILGVFFRPAAGLLAFTMFVAVMRHLNLPEGDSGAGWKGASHALELGCIYLGLLMAGPGRHALSIGMRRQ
ncbi:MAG: DoxX family protein [Gemmatimonadetes bacterium]|nr:DoxX family protein [Gemmatimonadota bacterium]